MGLRNFLGLFLAIFSLGIAAFFSYEVRHFVLGKNGVDNKVSGLIESLINAPKIPIVLPSQETKTLDNCHHYNCFNVYKCGGSHKKALVHIPQPFSIIKDSKEVSPPLTRDYIDILEAIVNSEFYTENPKEACVIIPAFNLINEAQLDPMLTSKSLASLPHWNGGENHLLISFVTGNSDSLRANHGSAMVAAAGYSTFSYRNQFDIALPSYTTLQEKSVPVVQLTSHDHPDLVVIQGDDLDPKLFKKVKNMKEMGIFYPCKSNPSDYEMREDIHGKRIDTLAILSTSKFCLIGKEKHGRLTTPMLMAAMHAGCVPIIAIDSLVLPFSEVVDWKRFSIRFYEHDVHLISNVLANISEDRYRQMKSQLKFVYDKYFKDLSSITHTILAILNERIFPQHGMTQKQWNVPFKSFSPIISKSNPPADDGFTAVILTYDRLESLYQVIQSVAQTPSLAKILVIWNNQQKAPPDYADMPVVAKNITIIQTSANVLTNRFHPFSEIQTEAVLSMDDDIVMLTSDELEFAYQVWREFPDRLVGFPSRTHVWNNATRQWRYESEWTNDVSMVLTGASFYHKYWHYLFTANPSPIGQEIKIWLDQRMNCEDIAMNFLIANATSKAPIKVTPRKKFKCSTPQCNNVDMLSNYQSHLTERSECVNFLAEKYGYMPLRNAEFRADPVLFKDKFPDKLKHFANIGSL